MAQAASSKKSDWLKHEASERELRESERVRLFWFRTAMHAAGTPKKGWDSLSRAFKLSAWAHKNQKRKTSANYFSHPAGAALSSVFLKQPLDITISLLLHDVIEEQSRGQYRKRGGTSEGSSAITVELIETLFDKNIARQVAFLTKPRWHAKKQEWVFAEDPRFYELNHKCPEEKKDEREQVYVQRLFMPPRKNNIIAGKILDVLDNVRSIDDPRLSRKMREGLARRYQLYFSPLASLMSPELYKLGARKLASVGSPLPDALAEWNKKKIAVHETLPHTHFPALEMLNNHPPAGSSTIILYWNGLPLHKRRFVVELPKEIENPEAHLIKLGLQGVKSKKSLLYGLLREHGAGNLFYAWLPAGDVEANKARVVNGLTALHRKTFRRNR